jgi:ferric-dicitrate binding protein FerR (iron transport regulator)
VNRNRLAVGAIVVAVVCAGGVALAYWTASGIGSGAATTGSAAAVTLNPGSPDLDLYPGGQADVTLAVSNPNTTALIIGSLVLDPTQGTGGFAVDAGHSSCDVSTLSFTTQTNAGAGWQVPAKIGTTNGVLAVDLPNALAMTLDASNACQGAQFSVYLVAGS